MTELRELGAKNLEKSKIIDYSQFISPLQHGLTNRRATFRSFEDEVNFQYASIIEKTAPQNRDSKRVGLLGYKVGSTHFWNKWGAMVPCTVIQIDRC